MRAKCDIEIVTGFLESGKTTFINGVLKTYSNHGSRILIIQCETGEVEIDTTLDKNMLVVKLDPQIPIISDTIKKLIEKESPSKIIIEHNGTRNIGDLIEALSSKELSKLSSISALYSIIDTRTFKIYHSNMGPMLTEPLSQSDLIIMNKTKGMSQKDTEQVHNALRQYNNCCRIICCESINHLDEQIKKYKSQNDSSFKKVTTYFKSLLQNNL